MMMMVPLFLLLVITLTTLPSSIHGVVPPKTPVLSGFGPAANGSYRELVCDASQPGAGTITYKWYKYSVGRNGVENWESKGPIGIGTSQKYVFNPVAEKRFFYSYAANASAVSGKYKCRASNSAGTRDSEWGDLYVYKPCSLYTVSVSPAKPAIGSTFTLNCSIPKPSGLTVNWLKRADASSTATDVAVANRKGCHKPSINWRYSWSSCSPPSDSPPTKTFNLQVTNAQPSDFAYWMCKDIGLSCDSNPVKPVVEAIPGPPRITSFPTGPVIAGAQLNLKCVASPTGDIYDWYKDGTKVTTSLTYDFQVTKESAGVYNCTARNDVGSATSSDNTLVVYYKADSVVVSSGKTSSHVGETEKFTCTVSGGNPTPTVKLYLKRLGGTLLEVTQGQDKIMAKDDNQAKYYCEAKVTGYPALDMTSSKKTYNVTFPPTVNMSANANPVKESDTLTLTCTASGGNPSVYTYKWFYKEKEILNETSKDYKITSIKYDQSGTYICQATNYPPKGKANDSLNIDIWHKAKWSPGFPVVLVERNEPDTTMKFILHVIANPSPTNVTWFFPNMTKIDGACNTTKVNDTTYTVTCLSKQSVGVNDYGNYTVNVTNAVGVSTLIFELNQRTVDKPPTSASTTLSTSSTLATAVKGPFTGAIAGGVGGFLFLLIIIAVVLALVFVLKRRRAEKETRILTLSNNNGDANGGQVNPGFSDLNTGHNDVTDVTVSGFNPNEHDDMVEMTSSPSSSTGIQIEATIAGGAEYAVVNKKGSKKPPVGDAYAEVDFKKKKAGKKKSAPPAPGGQAYAEVDFSKKSKKGKAPVPPAGQGDVYATVNKSKKTKPGKSGAGDQTVPANVPSIEDVRKEEPTENGYRQPKEAYQVGVDGTLYSQVQISKPKDPDVIRGKEAIEEPYASVDFSLQAPPLPEPQDAEDPDDPEDPSFMVWL